ncbi:very-long-chain (3R)-3-hydroxyacyl-CoA dehydratase 4 isoform X2 [Cinclus cinclus]|uniref:very-long-chain (3R)-3-hydroxyacyl-CoA dehydratase 4 isoform X2 n=1 Tax=Cinclus cinclus TaxID=127875 RepID=UPI002E0D7A93
MNFIPLFISSDDSKSKPSTCSRLLLYSHPLIFLLILPVESVADTFHSIGFVMRLCQLLSVLEILHILIGIDKSRLLPRFLQITERIIVLFVVINSQEEVQGKYVVCVLFFLWNLLDVIRHTYNMLARMGIYYLPLTWLNFSLPIPVYPLSVLAKGFAICVSLPYFESFGTYSIKLPFPFTFSIYFPYVLKMYLLVLFADTVGSSQFQN